MNRSIAEVVRSQRVSTLEELQSHYGEPIARSLAKEIDHISLHYRAFIHKAPFVVVATSGPEGLDCSPRGDRPGFVRNVPLRHSSRWLVRSQELLPPGSPDPARAPHAEQAAPRTKTRE